MPTLKHVTHVITGRVTVARVFVIHKKMNKTWKSILEPKDAGNFRALQQPAVIVLGPVCLVLLKEQCLKAYQSTSRLQNCVGISYR